MSEIQYSKATLPECCKRISERQKEPFRSCFLDVYHAMRANSGESFQKVFLLNMEGCLKTLPITSEDREHFLSFVSGESFEDGRMQLRAIERSCELLRLSIQNAEKENKEKCRLAVGLGAMSGLLLVVILI